MSNKPSDKNVGSIEEEINELKILLFQDRLTNYGKRKLIDYYENKIARQKQINEEHQKINGELIEKVKKLEEENNEMKSLFEIQASIAKELEFSEKDKMIKFRGNFYIPDTMTLNSEIGKEKRIELSYIDVSRLLENRIVKS